MNEKMTKEEAFAKAVGLANGSVSTWVHDGYHKLLDLLGGAERYEYTVYINGVNGVGDSYESAFIDWEVRLAKEIADKRTLLEQQLADLGGAE